MEFKEVIKRGDIYLVDLPIMDGSSLQGGKRPCIIISNDVGNLSSTTVNIVSGTSQSKRSIPVHAYITEECGVLQPTTILCEQITTIDKFRLIRKVGRCTEKALKEVEEKLLIQMGMIDLFDNNKAKNLADMIVELEMELNIYRSDRILSIYNGLIQEIKTYCSKFNNDYKQIINNRKRELGLSGCDKFIGSVV